MYPFSPWAWRDESWLVDEAETDDRPGADIVGYHVEALDGRIGSIDEANPDVGSACVVVDTGPWIFGHKVLLPAGTVRDVDHESRTVHVDRMKDQIKNAPAYDPDTAHTQEYRQRVGDYYGESYRTTPPL